MITITIQEAIETYLRNFLEAGGKKASERGQWAGILLCLIVAKKGMVRNWVLEMKESLELFFQKEAQAGKPQASRILATLRKLGQECAHAP